MVSDKIIGLTPTGYTKKVLEKRSPWLAERGILFSVPENRKETFSFDQNECVLMDPFRLVLQEALLLCQYKPNLCQESLYA